MSGDDFIALAGILAATARQEESRYRTAVSRAYYGAFHVAASFVAEFNVRVPRNHVAHNEVYRLLSSVPHPEPRRAAQFLNQLRGERNAADYDLSATRFREQANATLSVEIAHRVRTMLHACRQEPIRSVIVETIRAQAQRGGA